MWLCIYVDPRFKKAPMLTAARKSSIQSSLKYDLVTCIRRTLQLGILKASEIGAVKTAVTCVSNVVSHFHRSSKATYQLKEKQNLLGLKQHMLKSPCVTRWGSTYVRMRSLQDF